MGLLLRVAASAGTPGGSLLGLLGRSYGEVISLLERLELLGTHQFGLLLTAGSAGNDAPSV